MARSYKGMHYEGSCLLEFTMPSETNPATLNKPVPFAQMVRP